MGLFAIGTGDAGFTVVIGPVFAKLEVLIDFWWR